MTTPSCAPAQLSLAGLETPTEPAGLFLAVIPGADTAAQIKQRTHDLRKEHGLTGRPLAAKRYHITLHYIGAYASLPRGIVIAGGEAVASIKMAPFEITLDCAMSFSGRLGNQPLVLGCSDGAAALSALQHALSTAMAKAGLDRWKQPKFKPHVTLLYDERRVPEQPIEPISWTIDEFVLVRSLLGQSRYELLARWPLTD